MIVLNIKLATKNRMIKIQPLFIVLYFIFNIVSEAKSQENETIAFKNLGFRFAIPAGWNGKESEGSYLISSQKDASVVLISAYFFGNVNAFKRDLSEGIKKENGFFLVPSEELEVVDENRLQGKFSGLINFSPVLAYVVFLKGEQQQSVMIIAAIPKEKYMETTKYLALEVADGFEFFTPEMPSLIEEYTQLLNNSRLSFLGSEKGNDANEGMAFQTKITITLCGKGNFSYSDNNTQVYNGVSASVGGQGRWKIIKNQKGEAMLHLKFEDGEIIEYLLQYIDSDVYLDGDLYYRTAAFETKDGFICE